MLGKAPTKAILAGGKVVKAPDEGGPKLVVDQMFFDNGVSVDGGTEIDPIGNHGGHVHVSTDDPRSLLVIAKKAQELGMLAKDSGVGENPAFDTIDASHAPDGYHYHENEFPEQLQNSRLAKKVGAEGDVIGGALDIAGDQEQMHALNQWVLENMGKNPAPPTTPIKGTNVAIRAPEPAGGDLVAAPSGAGFATSTGSTSAGAATPQWTQRKFSRDGRSARPIPQSGYFAPGQAQAPAPGGLQGLLTEGSPEERASLLDQLEQASAPRRRLRSR